MPETSRLITHCGGTRRARAELATLACPPATPSWKPIPHADLVAELIAILEQQGVQVVRDLYCTVGPHAEVLMGTMDLAIPGLDSPDLAMGLGLRTSNNKTRAIEVIAAARVFVCDNWAFSGSEGAVCLKRKHTSGLDLSTAVPPAIELFLDKAGHYKADIDRLKEAEITSDHAKVLLHDAFTLPKPLLPVRLFPRTALLYLHDQDQYAMFPDRTLWSLEQAFTESVKSLTPNSQEEAGRRIGRFFSRLLRAKAEARALEREPELEVVLH